VATKIVLEFTGAEYSDLCCLMGYVQDHCRHQPVSLFTKPSIVPAMYDRIWAKIQEPTIIDD
jgi:hypothetical protein